MTTSIFKLKMPFVLWGTVTLYFAFQFVLRLTVGILREDIMKKFSVDTAAFGHLAGYYYLGYAGMQIPVGYMLDRFNIRFVTFLSILTASLGTLIFALATEWEYVLFARFLIGSGSAVGFLSVAKVTKSFFPEKMHSLMLGFAFTFGLSGAVIGGKPTKLLFDYFGYHITLNTLSIIALLLGFIILLVNDKKIEKFEYEQDSNISLKKTLKLMCNPKILFIGICGGFMVGSLEGFADVWAIPFLSQIYGYSEYESISATSIIYTGMCVGGPILAWSAEKFKSNIVMILMTGILTTTIFIILFSNQKISYNKLAIIMFCIGILCCYQVLVFTLATELVSKSWAGLSIAIINCINMSFGHFFHVGISKIIQNYWTGTVNAENIATYDLKAYIMALSPIPIFSLIGALGFLYLSIMQKKGRLKKIELD